MDTTPSNHTPLQQTSFQPPIPLDHELQSGSPKPDSPLPKLGAYVREVFDTYSDHLSIILGIALIPAVLAAFIGIFDPSQGGIAVDTLLQAVKSSYGEDAALLTIIVFAGVIVVSSIMELLLAPAIAEMLHTSVTPVEAASRAINRTGSYLWIAILVTFISLLGYLFFIVPGIIFQVFFSIAMIVGALEHRWGIEALIRSREYVRGRFFPVVGRFVAILFAFLVFMLITSVGMGTLTAGLPDALSLFLYNFVMSLFGGPFLCVAIYILFKHLSATRDLHAFVPSLSVRKLYKGAFIAGVSVSVIILASATVFIMRGEGKGWFDGRELFRFERFESR